MFKNYFVKISLSAIFSLVIIKNFAQVIDRFALINRHNVLLNEIDPLSPLSVGNGDFAYTVDVTGMQSFENFYYKNGIPLETLSTWAWHSFPNTKNLKLEDAMKPIDFHGRKIMYASDEKSEAAEYFRQNPHPVPLGQISIVQGNGQPLLISSISHVQQKLSLWQGVITSNFNLDGQPVTVETVCHPEKSLVAFNIKSALCKTGKFVTAIRFPYAYDMTIKNKPPFDWNEPDRHQTVIASQTANSAVLKRTIEGTVYFVDIHWLGNAELMQDSTHRFTLRSTGTDSLQIVCEFSSHLVNNKQPSFKAVKQASINYWKRFWTTGGVIDLSGSKDPRAPELERRIVLSQYLMKVNYAGSFPPQETGLTHISWYGKHNAEVYWWHVAQFYQFNHIKLLEKSFAWYKKILPVAVAQAKSEGFDGARWPKMSGIDGRNSPGSINPFIIWNQPNPIYLAELVYRAHPDKATLIKYSDIVFESAKFLASYAFYDRNTGNYILGPPIKSVNEHTAENNTQNPTFELAQWYYGLKTAQEWRLRLGMPREQRWDDVIAKLRHPAVEDGKYLEIETEPGMYAKATGGFSSDMIMAMGYLPKTDFIDKQIMTNTFDAIYQRNGLKSFISWSLGKGAMTAARLGEQNRAVDIVCNDIFGAKFLKNGHVQRAKEPLGCPAYLPANSAFLAAVALMAGGWDGAPSINAPGFPQDGNWHVRSEGLNKLP